MTNEKTVSLKQIAVDEGTQVRAAINEDVVANYAQAMARGDAFPPIVLFHDGNVYYLADGFHRVMAARRNGSTLIPSDVKTGTKADALWFALGANKANAHRMTEADKKHAVYLAFQTWPDRSQREISDQIGCAQSYVQKLRADYQVNTGVHLPNRITGKDGKNYPAVRGAEHPKAAEVRERIRAGESTETIRKTLGVSNDLIARERKAAGLSVRPDQSRESITQRRKDIADMAARGFSSRQIASELGLEENTVRSTAKKEGVVIHADRLVGGRKRHDANRIVEQIMMDAENLTADVDLIAFEELDSKRLGAWINSLNESKKSLSQFITRLTKEHSKHGQAA